jgi:hypothetical protein
MRRLPALLWGILSVVPVSLNAQTVDTLHIEDSASRRSRVLPYREALEPPGSASPVLLVERALPLSIRRPVLSLQSYQGQEPLPILDDFGEPIEMAEVRNFMDQGVEGALVGGTVGAGTGILLSSALFWKWMECGSDPQGSRCSPQEKALRRSVPLAGALFGGVLGGYIGWRIDRSTWDRALELVREWRREWHAARGGGS